MTTQSFKSVVSKSGSRVFIALPFNPNDVWESNSVTTSRGLLAGMVYVGRWVLMERNTFSLWVQPGGVVVGSTPAMR